MMLPLCPAGSEVAVLEGAMHELQGEMHSKRRDAYELEERLGDDNPVVFSSVQVNGNPCLRGTARSSALNTCDTILSGRGFGW